MLLTHQSIIIAIHIPKAFKPTYFPKITPTNILHNHIEQTPTIIVYFTSLAALNTLGSVKESGHIRQQHTPCNTNILIVATAVASES